MLYSDQIANSLKGAPVCERWTRTFINMALTKGEADQRGSRRARCVRRGAFHDDTTARSRRPGPRTSRFWVKREILGGKTTR